MELLKASTGKLHLRVPGQGRRGRRRGQSVVEMAMTLPLLVLLFAVLIDGGLGINSWLRVNTAARDGTRFAMDAGRSTDIKDLIMSKLNGLDANQVDVYIIKDTTDNNGAINTRGNGDWKSNSIVYHYGPGDTDKPRVRPATIEARLVVAADANASHNVQFTIVEVDYKYSTLLGSFIRQPILPMTSYALVQQYSQER